MRPLHARAQVLVPVLLGMFAACDQPEPTSLHPSSSPALFADGRGDVLVTGGGQYTGDFGLAKVAVHVVRHTDGSVTGQFQESESSPQVTVHGRVDCAVAIGNRVFVSGVLTNVLKANESQVYEGGGFMLVVEDNGEGPDAPADRASSFLFPARPQSCTNVAYQNYLVALWTYDLESGNFQVTQ
jgi:hypothetical protein